MKNPFVFGLIVFFVIFLGINIAGIIVSIVAMNGECNDPCEPETGAAAVGLFLAFFAFIFGFSGGLIGYVYRRRTNFS
jgi:Na+/melibiose symporter-like transporter